MAKALVIDDEQGIANVMRILLEAYGYEVLMADDGSRGFAAAQRQSPDVIVLDLMRPVMDGFEVLQALQQDRRTAGVPVLVVSGMKDASDRCKELGATDFLTSRSTSMI